MPRQGPRSGADTTVLVADDQEQFRDAVCELVAAVPGFVLVGVAASGEEAVTGVGSLSPELVLMDVRMPGLGGVRATREITDRYPHVVVMLMSVDGSDLLPEMIRGCGAAAFLRKQDLRPQKLRAMWEEIRPDAGDAGGRAV